MRGKSRGKRGGKRAMSNKTKPGKRKSSRQTYSLYSSKTTQKSFSDRKRKHKHENSEKDYIKRQKQDEPPNEEEKPMTSSSSEDEQDEDHMQKLLCTFSGHNVGTTLNSDSDDTEDEEEDEMKNANLIEIEDKIVSNNEEDEESDIIDENKIKVDKPTKDLQTLKKIDENGDDLNENAEYDENVKPEDMENDQSDSDPFNQHILYDINENLRETLQSCPIPVTKHEDETWTELGRLLIELPISKTIPPPPAALSIEERRPYAAKGKLPIKITRKHSLQDLHIKPQIINNIKRANSEIEALSDHLPLSKLQSELFSILNNYQDLYIPQRSVNNIEEVRFVYCLHVINHVMKTRLKIIHHNARLTKKDDVSEEFRDQGLVRPKVLIVLPFRDAAYKTINILINLLIEEDKGNVMNKKRFVDEFTGDELIMPKKNPKPLDYEQLFAGNSNDDFKMGIAVTKKTLKLYADFYSADIIIASPLGLRRIIGAEGEAERDYDFLASIELLILDQTEVFLMQNWDHLLHIFKHLHLLPKESHGTDFSRVRTWSLDGWGKFYRQTIILSSVQLPEINSIFNKHCCNYAGKVRASKEVKLGAIRNVYLQLPHVYHKFRANSSADAIEERFQFFIHHILTQQKDTLMRQTLVYVANYFDYVRLRNYFKKEDIGFVQICEYTKDAKIARARDMFFHGDAHFLLYTERYHFFNRKRIKGIRHIIFYQLPNFPHFYYEMCNLMLEGNMNKKVGSSSNMTVSAIYSKYDILQLSAIVGTERAVKMVGSERSVHMLVTDS